MNEETRKCNKCEEVKHIEEFRNYKDKKGKLRKRSYCKSCESNYKRLFAKNHPVEHKARQMAENIYKRLGKYKDSPSNKCYKDNNIKSKIGNGSGEIYQYIIAHFYKDIKEILDRGEIPSIDRIDPTNDYEDGNLRIITFEENSRLGREQSLKVWQRPIRITYANGEIKEYSGIKAGAKQAGISQHILQKILKGKTRQKKEFHVEYII